MKEDHRTFSLGNAVGHNPWGTTVLTGDLDKYFYSETFRKQTGRAPRILDTVNFYRDIEVLMKFLKEQFSHSSGEYKE